MMELGRTLVLPCTSAKALEALQTRVVPVGTRPHPKVDDRFLFWGLINENTFRIIERKSPINNFQPIIKGKVMATSLGSIVTLTFSLTFATKVIIGLSGIMALSLGLFFLSLELYLYAGATGLFIASSTLITWLLFSKESKNAQAQLERVFYSLV